MQTYGCYVIHVHFLDTPWGGDIIIIFLLWYQLLTISIHVKFLEFSLGILHFTRLQTCTYHVRESKLVTVLLRDMLFCLCTSQIHIWNCLFGGDKLRRLFIN